MAKIASPKRLLIYSSTQQIIGEEERKMEVMEMMEMMEQDEQYEYILHRRGRDIADAHPLFLG